MPMKSEKVFERIEAIAPVKTQEEWDNSGIQILLPTAETRRVLICLEITEAIIDEAEKNQIDLIITHHPLIFEAFSSIDSRGVTGGYISRLIRLGISVYCSHTPFDKAAGGNNDYLASRLGLRDISGFSKNGELEMLGRVGQFSVKKTLRQAAEEVKQALELENLKIAGRSDTQIQTVGICAGAGAELIELAKENGCQLLITGDLKHHDAQKAKAIDLCIIDAGHYGTEKFFTENFAKKLAEHTAGQIEIFESEVNVNPFSAWFA